MGLGARGRVEVHVVRGWGWVARGRVGVHMGSGCGWVQEEGCGGEVRMAQVIEVEHWLLMWAGCESIVCVCGDPLPDL